ncbi:MAG: hypothetical protein HFJ09_01885 [Lachnospiraceae bacterium]|nr:hypothetical protein [Lachnospiraceae bacterium]
MANFFGIRHLSPACAYYVQEFLDRTSPKLVLIEGPSDLSELIDPLCSKEAVSPVAILAYTDEPPVKTVLWPFAEFSPEYQAMLWAYRHKVPVRFCDLPAKVTLALEKEEEEREEEELKKIEEETQKKSDSELENSQIEEYNVYDQLEKYLGVNIDSFWEYNFEYNESYEDFMEAAIQYGGYLREFSKMSRYNQIREAYMRKVIAGAVEEGTAEEQISVITGAFHTIGLKDITYSKEDEKLLERLPELSSKATLMPYSYYRLSSRSGYGAGSKAPGFYEILWKNRIAGKQKDAAAQYLTLLAKFQREKGYGTSSAEVIEALRLSNALAGMRNGTNPSLEDLRDAAITCMGHGSFGEISLGCAATEIGTKIGYLPKGVVCTSVQEDFQRQLKDLKLERYLSPQMEELELDLRENLRVKSEKSAFLDLNRSFFLHRMRVLGIHFCKTLVRQQDNATWAELWALQWNPEVEIEIVEASLKGDTILQAAQLELSTRLNHTENLGQAARILSEAFLCGIPKVVDTAVLVVQNMAADCTAVMDIGNTLGILSSIMRFGNLRRLETSSFIPLMEALFLRFCLGIGNEAVCDNSAADGMITAMEKVNAACLSHEFLNEKQWITLLGELADRDDINMKISGFSAAILTERGNFTNEVLAELISRRLSKGTPSSDGAGWFEGLSLKNRRSLISRLSLWEKLFEYVSGLDEEEFKPALVCLRRTFSVFSPSEKADIAENIGEVLGISKESASEFLSAPITEVEQEAIDELDDFDFGDI